MPPTSPVPQSLSLVVSKGVTSRRKAGSSSAKKPRGGIHTISTRLAGLALAGGSGATAGGPGLPPGADGAAMAPHPERRAVAGLGAGERAPGRAPPVRGPTHQLTHLRTRTHALRGLPEHLQSCCFVPALPFSFARACARVCVDFAGTPLFSASAGKPAPRGTATCPELTLFFRCTLSFNLQKDR